MFRLPGKLERRIAFIEPVFDLMYVYLLRRHNGLLEPEGSFFTSGDFAAYLISTLVILQIWATSTMYINRFAKGGIADYAILFGNLYFLYYIGMGTWTDWFGQYAIYHIAWALILLNYLIQFIRLRTHPENRKGAMGKFLRSRIILFSVQIGLVLLAIPWHPWMQRTAIWLPLAVGFAGPVLTRKIDAEVPMDFHYLSERVQSLVLIVFGEIIISIGAYFTDQLDIRDTYFSLCAFLVTVGLLLSYGYVYLHMIDRHHCRRGYLFMFVHVIVVIALSCVSVSFEIMLESEIDRWASHIFMVVAMLTYYFTLCLLAKVAGKPQAQEKWLPSLTISLDIAYSFAMLVWYSDEAISAGASVLYTFLMLECLIHHWHARKKKERQPSAS